MIELDVSRRFEMLLPGTWWRIPLAPAAATETSIRKMVEDSIGRSDERAAVRRELRTQVSEAAARARRGGGEVMFFSREIMEGVPLPVSLTVLRPEVELDVMVASQPDRNLPLLEGALKRASRDKSREHWRSFVSGGAAIVRSTSIVSGSIPGDDESPTVPTLVTDYWAVAPGSVKPIIFSFSTSMPQLAESFIELFDAIIESIDWPEAVTPEDGDEPDSESVTADSVS